MHVLRSQNRVRLPLIDADGLDRRCCRTRVRAATPGAHDRSPKTCRTNGVSASFGTSINRRPPSALRRPRRAVRAAPSALSAVCAAPSAPRRA
ncbi:hypothetical protein K1W54_37895, partial [Micromonospora sp. CPCC 205371]|nr:hypothetical protein [Micromonospora sp. CPCC 205371]